jgi:hypothetical protein
MRSNLFHREQGSKGQSNRHTAHRWLALPFADPTTGDPPTGDQSWALFLNTAIRDVSVKISCKR